MEIWRGDLLFFVKLFEFEFCLIWKKCFQTNTKEPESFQCKSEYWVHFTHFKLYRRWKEDGKQLETDARNISGLTFSGIQTLFDKRE